MDASNSLPVDFITLLQRSTNQLLSFAISLTKNDFEAEDLYQDTVFLALKNKEKFNAGTPPQAFKIAASRGKIK